MLGAWALTDRRGLDATPELEHRRKQLRIPRDKRIASSAAASRDGGQGWVLVTRDGRTGAAEPHVPRTPGGGAGGGGRIAIQDVPFLTVRSDGRPGIGGDGGFIPRDAVELEDGQRAEMAGRILLFLLVVVLAEGCKMELTSPDGWPRRCTTIETMSGHCTVATACTLCLAAWCRPWNFFHPGEACKQTGKGTAPRKLRTRRSQRKGAQLGLT